MAKLRTGRFGEYYGSMYLESEPLTQSEMEKNAAYIYSFMKDKGWSDNAIAAILGNMQAESSLNPGRWQSEDIGNTEMGYGLVQWTPATKYLNWCDSQGFGDASELDANLFRIIYEVENAIQWIPRGKYYKLSFAGFSVSTLSVSELAVAFLLCYERPADQSASVQAYRAGLAESWFQFLHGRPPTPPTPTPGEKTNARKFNFLLLNQRRRKTWTKQNF